MYITLNDHELSLLLKQGNEQAYSEIYTRYWPLLFRHSYRMLADEDQAMDVVQDIFTSLWLNREAIDFKISLSAYLYTAARNRTVNVINKSKLQLTYMESLQKFIDQGAYVTDELVRYNELSAEIEAEISKLPPRMREIFELRRNAGLSYKQIATQLGLSDETVKTQVARALKVLRTKFGVLFTLPFI
ncbi:RNA polymerase sigma factor [Pedobacter sp. AW31-3R]|uniref:RNA polymerase sigma factor n=1 Tax=Pedobacter sp. AW31-3R TaxID=3445781 RepID=UPI003F9FF121